MGRLYSAGRLGEIAGLGARGISEIEAGLLLAGLQRHWPWLNVAGTQDTPDE